MAPVAAAHPCAEPRCPALLERGTARCQAHDLKRRYYAEHPRPSSTQQGYGAVHRQWRRAILARDPVCRHCGIAQATHADHITALRKGGDFSLENGQGLCASCHNRKTAKEGRWG